MRYAVVYEQTPRNLGAYVPDLPGCVATGASQEEVESRIREGGALHLEAMRQSGEPVPPATTIVGSVEVG